MKKIKKQKTHIKVCHKKIKFEDCKHCIEAIQLENEINQPVTNKFDVESIRENHKEFIKNNKLILKITAKI